MQSASNKVRIRRWLHRAAILWLGSALGFTLNAMAQMDAEPHWFTLRPSNGYLRLDVEAEQQTVSSSSGGTETTLRRTYIAPAVGIGAVGSIYHPNLLTYDITVEPGYAWQQADYTTGSTTSHSQQDSVLQNYHGLGTLFETKPFITTVSGSRTHDITQYDFFNNAVADSQSFGVATGYREGPVPVTLTYQQATQDATSLAQHTIFDQETVEFHAHNDRRDNNNTDLSYRYGDYQQDFQSGPSTFHNDSTYQFARLTDFEKFGLDDHLSLNSSVTYIGVDSLNQPSRTLTGQSDFGVQHTPNLSSFYDYTFSWFSDDFSDFQQHFLRAGIQHRLYESLTSGVEVHGGLIHATFSGSTLDTTTGGLLATLGYSKRLGTWGHFSMGNSAGYDLVDQSSSGSGVIVPNESHTLSVIPSPLKTPRVFDIVSVTDATGTQPLQEGFDYTVNRGVDPWELQRVATSPLVHEGDTILVTYDVESNPSGSYSIFSDQFQVRLDLFDQMLGLYSRINVIDNFTNGPGFVLEDLWEFQVGAEFRRGGLRLGADYTKHNSTLYDFTSKGFLEGYTFKSFGDSTFSIDLNQRWNDYPEQNQSAAYYDFIGRYEWSPLTRLSVVAEGGLERQRGRGLDQDITTARVRLDWHAGKLSLNLGYDYQSQDFSGELRERHFIYLRARRNF